MILIISLCSEKLHDLEFVKPIEKIVKAVTEERIIVRRLEELEFRDTKRADKIIISGTSLKDFSYWNKFEMFNFLKDYEKPVLGICAGMQIIGRVFGGELLDEGYIGPHYGNFVKSFSDKFFEEGESVREVYYLHNKAINLPDNFEKLNEDLSYPTAFKHKVKEIYGVLFHPEVYNHEVIREFVNL